MLKIGGMVLGESSDDLLPTKLTFINRYIIGASVLSVIMFIYFIYRDFINP